VVVSFQGGRIQWTVAPSEEDVDEQSFIRARAVRLRGVTGPLVEVFGMTHMGNGNYYLFQLRGRELRLTLKTFAVDTHWPDNNLIQGEHLRPQYLDLNGDGYDDVALTGVVQKFGRDPDADPAPPYQAIPCQKIFHWNPQRERFVEDKSRRFGFECYGDPD
jgi:hypothetical protein